LPPRKEPYRRIVFFFFPEKEAKSVSSRSFQDLNLPRSGTRGGWGLAPKKRRIVFIFFQKKKQKALVLEAFRTQNFREAEPGGFGGLPPRKEAKRDSYRRGEIQKELRD
jgi:hypothetical protein